MDELRALYRSIREILPLVVFVWCLVILALTVLMVIRGGWMLPDRASRPTSLTRPFVFVYGTVFVLGLALAVVVFALL